MGLREYRQKRDFARTHEPSMAHGESTPEQERGFVIQKHAASRLHYDFRLEMDGVLKSWAVPKGIPFAKGEKRLAVRVEDHPLEYAAFEGGIPSGEYGAGTVMVWDRGEYTVSGGSPTRALKEGKLHLVLSGEKLQGEWTLVRPRTAEDNEKESWFLMKTGDSIRPLSRRRDDQSAISGRSMTKIAADRDATWHSAPGSSPAFREPMKAKLVRDLPSRKGWVIELKFDGYRAIAIKNRTDARLISRNEKPLRFPEIAEAVAALPCRSAVLDGEVVALDAGGKPSFQLIQARELGIGEPAPIRYYLFDLLELDGADQCQKPLEERKERLAELLRDAGEPLRYSANLPGEASEVLAQVRARGLEGIVAKREGSRYEPGARKGTWLKLKCVNKQEFVVGGYTRSDSRCFASLLVGYYEGGKLRFAGKAGSGFSQRQQERLFERFQKMRTEACPFGDLPSKSAGRWSQGISPAQMKQCTWLRPELVCEVKFTEWTRDGKLRQPIFLGLREDRSAESVARETPAQ
jgi:bifunctional non-homologous end joining protein LigD